MSKAAECVLSRGWPSDCNKQQRSISSSKLSMTSKRWKAMLRALKHMPTDRLGLFLGWSLKFRKVGWCRVSDCQGGLDLQYLSQRYEKGKEKTREFMTTHQLYESSDVGGLPDLHARLLQLQASLNDKGDSLLVWMGWCVALSCHYFMLSVLYTCFCVSANFRCLSILKTHSKLIANHCNRFGQSTDKLMRMTLMILDASLWPSRSLDPISSSGHVRRQSAVTKHDRYEVCPPQSERVYDMIYKSFGIWFV